jgi:hypothetical protein
VAAVASVHAHLITTLALPIAPSRARYGKRAERQFRRDTVRALSSVLGHLVEPSVRSQR